MKVKERHQNGRDQDAGKATYASVQELVIQYLLSAWSRGCAARTVPDMDVRLKLLAMVFHPHQNGVSF